MTAPQIANPFSSGPHTAERETDWRKADRERRAAFERLTDSDPFASRYYGTCAECGGKIEPGDEIVRQAAGTYAHAVLEQCERDVVVTVGNREVLCGRCFCYHAGECA